MRIQRLPWDTDLDTQVSDTTLHLLGAVHNQTRYQYVSDDGTVQREYLLDVNPWIWERERGDGANIIDARWIDTRNGLFIDITGLSEIHPDTHPGLWSCKNYHRYQTSDLYPMRETMFEGVLAKVPYDYDKILVDEYQEKALTTTEFEGYVTPCPGRGYRLTWCKQAPLGPPCKRVGEDATHARHGRSGPQRKGDAGEDGGRGKGEAGLVG